MKYQIIDKETGKDFAEGELFESKQAVRDFLETTFIYDWDFDHENERIENVSLETILENCNLAIEEVPDADCPWRNGRHAYYQGRCLNCAKDQPIIK